MEEKYIKISNRVETRECGQFSGGPHPHSVHGNASCHLGHKKCITSREKSSSNITLSSVWLSTDNNHIIPSFKNFFSFLVYKDFTSEPDA